MSNGDHPDFQKALANLVEIFAAGDGGVKLVTFRVNMNQLYIQASNGDQDAREILTRFDQVCNLITYLANK